MQRGKIPRYRVGRAASALYADAGGLSFYKFLWKAICKFRRQWDQSINHPKFSLGRRTDDM